MLDGELTCPLSCCSVAGSYPYIYCSILTVIPYRYGSAFNLPAAALIPFTGKLYSMFSTKIIFLASFFIFEVGSLLSALAPTSISFIVGRALCGAGAAGIFNGAFVTIFMVTPLRKRPAYQTIISGTSNLVFVLAIA
jgi:MFS family permease